MKYLSLIALLFLLACGSSRQLTRTPAGNTLVVDGKIWSSVFQQRAAEYKALCIQAFYLARTQVDLLPSGSGKPRAIITDIDETFLDNSPYAVHQAFQGKDYEADSWHAWTARAEADTLAGALSFFRYAASKGIDIFYVTNRDEVERAGTLRNLQLFGFPQATDDHLLLRQTSSSKESRRQQIARTHDIVMLLGDNLADFSDLFDKKTEAERSANVDALRASFGTRFIVLPNANYGGWEDAIYQNSRNWTPAQKDSLLRAGLRNY